MVLPGIKQTVQKRNPELGIDVLYHDVIELYIRLAHGRDYTETGRYFYSCFFDAGHPLIPDTIEEVQEALQDAWWVEDDDLRQEILLVIYRYRNAPPPELKKAVSRHLRRYLVWHQRVFIKNADHLHLYGTGEATLYEPRPNWECNDFFLSDFCLHMGREFTRFERYLLYLYCHLGLSKNEICAIIVNDQRQVKRFFVRLRKHMEDFYGSATSG